MALTIPILRIRKIGTTYYFDYKANNKDPWINAGSHTTAGVPQSVGVIVKKWNYNYPPLNFDCDYINLHYINGSRTSPVIDISPAGKVESSRVLWNTDLPVGTGLTVETNLSLDGGATWQGWQQVPNRDEIPGLTSGTELTNARLMYKTTLSATDTVTPQLHDLTITIMPTDSTAPTVDSSNPIDGGLDVPIDGEISVTFDEAIFEGLNFNEITVTENVYNTAIEYTYRIDANVLEIAPTGNLDYSTGYTVHIPAAAVDDRSGNASETECRFSFTTISNT